MANIINPDKVYKEFGVKTGENTSEFFEIGADARNVFIQNAEHTQYGDIDGVVDLQTKLDNFNKSVRNIGSGNAANNYTTAFGNRTSAEGEASHAEGAYSVPAYDVTILTQAKGDASHAEGRGTISGGEAAHSEGYLTQVGHTATLYNYNINPQGAAGAHAEGLMTIATKLAAHAEGIKTQANSPASHAEGEETAVNARGGHAEGWKSAVSGQYAHAEGNSTTASGENSHAEGFHTEALGNRSHAEGMSTTASGQDSHAEGSSTQAVGGACHTEGRETIATGEASHAEGKHTIAEGLASHAEGRGTQALDESAHAEGYETKANGIGTHAEGVNTIAIGDGSHAEGLDNYETGPAGHVEGQGHFVHDGFLEIPPYAIRVAFEKPYYDENGYKMTSFEKTPINLQELPVENIEDYRYLVSGFITSLPEELNYDDIKNKYIKAKHSLGHPLYGDVEVIMFFAGNARFIALAQTSLYIGPDFPQYDTFIFSHQLTLGAALLEPGHHVQGRYSVLKSSYAHVVGGGSSDSDRKNIHNLDWSGNAEFAGDVIAYGCNGANPIKLSSLGELGSGSLVVREEDDFTHAYYIGNEILRAIKAGRQILIELINKGQNNTHRLYSPVITYHLPKDKDSKLSLFYLPDQVDISGGLSSLFAEIQVPVTETLFPN